MLSPENCITRGADYTRLVGSSYRVVLLITAPSAKAPFGTRSSVGHFVTFASAVTAKGRMLVASVYLPVVLKNIPHRLCRERETY